MDSLYAELEATTAAVLAAEDWAPGYAKAPKQHALLIRNIARLERLVLVYFRDLGKDASKLVNWYNYHSAVYEQQRALQQATLAANTQKQPLSYDVQVIVNKDIIQQEDQAFIKLLFDTVQTTTSLGMDSMEVEHELHLGLTSTSKIVQDLTTEQLGNLVGMRVNPDTGLLEPNTNTYIDQATKEETTYSIDETTRNKIVQSIKTSINLGEDQADAAARMQKVITDPYRASMIAQTEGVRAYSNGRMAYAQQSGAVAKDWTDHGATDVCVANTADGWIPLAQAFTGGVQAIPQHNWCRCNNSFSYNVAKLNK